MEKTCSKKPCWFVWIGFTLISNSRQVGNVAMSQWMLENVEGMSCRILIPNLGPNLQHGAP